MVIRKVMEIKKVIRKVMEIVMDIERVIMLVLLVMVIPPVSSCRHKFSNGSEINLMMVASVQDDTPRFADYHAQNASDKALYTYNPCFPYTYPPDGQMMACRSSNDVAVCQADEGYINIGTQDSATFYFDPTSQKWIVSYYNPIGDKLTNVTLQCTTDQNDTLIVWGETKGNHRSVYNMTLVSRCACVDGCGTPILPRGMSVGSFMLLLLVIAVGVYLVVGYLYRRLIIGARGIELLPHISFWMDFPLLVQDGFFFLVRCGPHDMTYERI
ncbi:hypothetical protein Pcinc_041251 [Petrolisthes cinctipes]|uniref:Cation-dependent mannose-6-phosphate receptor n=1 Tax=Petrolisthes cinctipes TaxID=88211 RepID=A0AAE1EK01_PETCI|nr:hypothetical protein Pcinc_041251 [Petrolisthes cinctipes]